jgi:hypothetical protein
MRRKLAYIFALITWSAVVMQYFIMLGNNSLSWLDGSIRFFSYFTILTNTLLAIYFSSQIFGELHQKGKIWKKPGTLKD